MGPVIRGAIEDVLRHKGFQQLIKAYAGNKALELGMAVKRKYNEYNGNNGRGYSKMRRLNNGESYSRKNAATGTDSVRFNDMGDRGGVSVVRAKRRMRKRIPYRKRIRQKRFKKAVRRVMRPKLPMNVLQEFWGEATWNASTPDTLSSTLAGNVQLILGNAATWGINLGELAAGGQTESSWINQELSDYRLRIKGVDLTPTDNTSRDHNAHWVSRRYLKLTIRNRSTDKDLSFNLYEMQAAMDISDANYANPVVTLAYLASLWAGVTTDLAGLIYAKGTEPTDVPTFGKYWKILKKYKVRIPFASNINNAIQTFKMHSKPHMHRGSRANEKYAIKGQTKYFMLIVEPEQGPAKYSGADTAIGVWGHRNTHYKTFQWDSQVHATNTAPNWMRSTLTTPTL